MSEKCFCHFNCYQVKDATARAAIATLTNKVNGLAGEVSALKQLVQNLPTGGGSADTYTIAFYTRKEYNDNGVINYTANELISTETYAKGAPVVMPQVPTLNGYVFAWENAPDTATGNLVVIGTYSLIETPEEPDEPEEPKTKYKVTLVTTTQKFNTDGSAYYTDTETVAEPTYEEGTIIKDDIQRLAKLYCPNQAGYYMNYFVGNAALSDNYAITSDITVKVEYLPRDYTATFVTSTGQSITAEVFPFGYPLETPLTPEISGYSFSHWEPEISTMPAADTTFTAVYVEAVAQVKTATLRQGTTDPKATDVITIEFEDGMTWEEWMASDYYNSFVTVYTSPTNGVNYLCYLGNCDLCRLKAHSTGGVATLDSKITVDEIYEFNVYAYNKIAVHDKENTDNIMTYIFYSTDLTFGDWFENSTLYDPRFINVTGTPYYGTTANQLTDKWGNTVTASMVIGSVPYFKTGNIT